MMSWGEQLIMGDERRCCQRELLQLPLQIRYEQTQGVWVSALMLDASATGLSLTIPDELKLCPDEPVDLRLMLSKSSSYDLGAGTIHHVTVQENCTVLGIELKERTPFLTEVGMLGISSKLLEIKSLLPKISSSGLNILIRGETGTGKNVLAKLIHNMRRGKQSPFIRVNCPSIPDSLFESELFGHEKGAFTDAKFSTPGYFRLAAEGTILLDEISEIQPHLQAKLLSVIEDKKFVSVGGQKVIPVRANIIATSNLDLEKAVDEGRFRRDLYYRLCEIPIHMPSLSERKEDVALLAHYFLLIYCQKFSCSFQMLSDAEIKILKDHSWPGNIRELENYMKQMALLGEFVCPSQVTPHSASEGVNLGAMDFLNDLLAEENTLPEIMKKMTVQMERTVISKMLETCNQNKTSAASRLGISYRTLLRKLKLLHLP
jgi:transcriptional regulator with PAS, ATPase and Fis domain